MMKKKLFQWQTHLGEKIKRGNLTVTPQAQALVVSWPNGGLVWNRPVAVLVEQEGQVTRIPIVDVTRLVQIGLVGLSLGLIIGNLILSIRQRRKRNE